MPSISSIQYQASPHTQSLENSINLDRNFHVVWHFSHHFQVLENYFFCLNYFSYLWFFENSENLYFLHFWNFLLELKFWFLVYRSPGRPPMTRDTHLYPTRLFENHPAPVQMFRHNMIYVCCVCICVCYVDCVINNYFCNDTLHWYFLNSYFS